MKKKAGNRRKINNETIRKKMNNENNPLNEIRDYRDKYH